MNGVTVDDDRDDAADHDTGRRFTVRRFTRRRPLAISARLGAAVLAGLLMFAGFPPRDYWFFAPIAVAVLVLTLRGRSITAGAGYGFVAGLAFFVPLLPWVGEYVGAAPWLALATVEALFVALFGALATRVVRVPWSPIWLAATWVAVEALRSRLPFGGFPWGRLAFGQADGPLLPLAALAGASRWS